MHLCLESEDLSIKEQTILIIFLDHCFNSLVSRFLALNILVRKQRCHSKEFMSNELV